MLNGYVSAEAAAADYGVALTGDGRGVDTTATERQRADRQPVTGLFHRGTYRDVLE